MPTSFIVFIISGIAIILMVVLKIFEQKRQTKGAVSLIVQKTDSLIEEQKKNIDKKVNNVFLILKSRINKYFPLYSQKFAKLIVVISLKIQKKLSDYVRARKSDKKTESSKSTLKDRLEHIEDSPKEIDTKDFLN